jgi:hypothetical protein
MALCCHTLLFSLLATFVSVNSRTACFNVTETSLLAQ